MKFLKTLLWVVIAASAIGLAVRNWRDVTLTLWGELQLDIKIPVLMLAMVFVGWLPAWIGYRARSWRHGRRPVPASATPSLPSENTEGTAA